MRKDWKFKKIIDSCLVTDFVANGSFASLRMNVKYNYEKDYAVLIRTTDFVKNWKKDFVYVSKGSYDFLSKSKLTPGDIIISNVGDPGITFIVPDLGLPMTLGPNSILVRALDKNELTQMFLLYLFKSEFGQSLINDITTGAAQRKFNKSNFRELEIPIPPLPEQKSIVAILDEAFAAIDQAKANVQENLQNAKDLFESYLQNVFANQDEEWINETLEALLEKGWIVSHLDGNHGGEYPRKEEFKSKGVPYISANCIKGTEVDFSLCKFLTAERAKTIRKGIAINNDVLFAHNATVGPVALLKTNEEKVILGTSLTYYRCNSKYILPEYLANYMRSREFKQQYEIVMRQSTRNQVPITKQREFYHIIPPIKIQKELIINLESLLNNSQLLEASYRQKLNYLEELKKSILQKAFTGELTYSGLKILA